MIYLDNAATSYPKAPGVASAVTEFITSIGANAGRSSYRTARESSRIIYQTRKLLAELLEVSSEERICFCLNTTQALNIAIKGMIKPGNTILTSPLEHNSVMRPLRWLESNQSIIIKQFRIKGYEIDWQHLDGQLAEQPDLLIFTAASNVNGYILPFQEIARRARKRNIPVILDAAQALGSLPVKGDDYDVVCFPGHKGLLGPMGTGGLYVGKNVELDSLIQGGTGSSSSNEYQPEDLPDRLESGTPNIPGICGLKAGLEFILKTGVAGIRERKREITDYLLQNLSAIQEINIHSPLNPEIQSGVVSITSNCRSISELAWELDKAEIASRMGLHCAPSAHKTIGTFKMGGTLRLSPGYFNTKEEIDQVISLLKELHK